MNTNLQKPNWCSVISIRGVRIIDALSGWLIGAMIVFAPWAFGTTQAWSIHAMNVAGFSLGILLLAKIIARKLFAKTEAKFSFDAALLALTFLILLYCSISAWNSRATFSYVDASFSYHDFIAWLPHSYDSNRSWEIFWNYLALACSFWAIRDWIQNDDLFPSAKANPLFSRRWKKLLWIIAINGALVGLEGFLQRADGTGKLLWLVTPRIHKDAVSQFGPYAYRSNGAQFLNLTWPIAVGLWWSLQRSVARSGTRHSAQYLLLPAAMLMAAGAIISLSRGGLLVAAGTIGLTSLVLLAANRRATLKIKIAIASFGVATVALATFVSWTQLKERFLTVGTDQLSGRFRLYEIALKIIHDYPIFGTGPNTFDPVSQLYLESPDATWTVQAHNDWLETLATFGWVGSSLIWLALLLVLTRPLRLKTGMRHRTTFVSFFWIALGGCLIHGIFDFPFQVYSILFLFLVLCAILSTITIRKTS
jgi:hypothetical protein